MRIKNSNNINFFCSLEDYSSNAKNSRIIVQKLRIYAKKGSQTNWFFIHKYLTYQELNRL